MKFPRFKYHPDPIATGAIEESADVCICCNHARGYIYKHELISKGSEGYLCPWCIESGEAAQKFHGRYSNVDTLQQAKLSSQIIDEIAFRTPGFASWQIEKWEICCNDGCEFHGDVSQEEFRGRSLEFARSAFRAPSLDKKSLENWKKNYQSSSPSVFKWTCRHCQNIYYQIDSP